MEILKAPVNKNGKSIACIGAGPASLSCATKLALNGYNITIYEQYEKSGGVLTYGITPSRLPQEAVDYDIEKVKNLGVNFKFNARIDGIKDIEQLKNDCVAVFIGVGLWKSSIPDIQGKEARGVYSEQEFLKLDRENNGKIKLGMT